MDQAAPPPAAPTGRQQRRMRNYLLDRRFQLKYSGYFVGIAALLSVALGVILWLTSQELLAQSQQLVERGQAVVTEGKKVSDVVRMNIVKDPDYGGDAELLKAFEEGDQEYTKELEAQQAQLAQQSAHLKTQHRTAAFVLTTTLVLFVFFVGIMGILVTHKVAGPIFKMKRQITEVAEGTLKLPSQLRKGDELVDFFNAFHTMVTSLRERQQKEIEVLERCITALDGRVEAQDLDPLRALLADMKAALER